MWFRRKVKTGHKLGRELGYPTLNFSIGNFSQYQKTGVYTCQIKIKRKIHEGTLYFGPKLSKPGNSLEIFILNFKDNIYAQLVSFRVSRKIREPMKFTSTEKLKKQIQKDVASIV